MQMPTVIEALPVHETAADPMAGDELVFTSPRACDREVGTSLDLAIQNAEDAWRDLSAVRDRLVQIELLIGAAIRGNARATELRGDVVLEPADVVRGMSHAVVRDADIERWTTCV